MLILAGFEYAQADSWYHWAWARRVSVTIDSRMIDDDLSGFPVLVTEEGMSESLFQYALEDGSDIAATAGDGQTKLKRELVEFDRENQSMELYVKVPLISTSEDTVFYLYYDNPQASETNDAEVWDENYSAVYHMNDGEDRFIVEDSTPNGFDGTKVNIHDPDPVYEVKPSIEIEGKIGKAQDFDHSIIDCGVHPEFNLGRYFTLEAWGVPDTDDQYNGALIAHDMMDTGRQYALIQMDGDPPRYTRLQVNKTGDYRVGTQYPDVNLWNHMVGRYNHNLSKSLFLNGLKETNEGNGDLNDAPNSTLIIGTHHLMNWSYHPGFRGAIDEVRISNLARSDAWILAGYRNQSDPAAFYRTEDELSSIPVFNCFGLLILTGIIGALIVKGRQS